MELNTEDKQRIQQEGLDTLWEKMSREDWLAGEGFSGKMGGLTKIPTVCKPRIFEFAKEYATIYERERAKTLFEWQAIAWEDKVKDKNEEIESLKAKLKQWDLDALEAQGGIEEDSQTIKRQINEIAEWKEIYQRLESNFLKLTTEIKQLEAERSELAKENGILKIKNTEMESIRHNNKELANQIDELRNKVIDEAIDKLFRGVSLNEHQRGDIEQLLNSLKK